MPETALATAPGEALESDLKGPEEVFQELTVMAVAAPDTPAAETIETFVEFLRPDAEIPEKPGAIVIDWQEHAGGKIVVFDLECLRGDGDIRCACYIGSKKLPDIPAKQFEVRVGTVNGCYVARKGYVVINTQKFSELAPLAVCKMGRQIMFHAVRGVSSLGG